MSPWPRGSHRVIPCRLIIAKEREMGNCQVGTLFRGYFFKKFREFWPTKATVLRVKMSQGKMRNQGEKAEIGQSSHRRSGNTALGALQGAEVLFQKEQRRREGGRALKQK